MLRPTLPCQYTSADRINGQASDDRVAPVEMSLESEKRSTLENRKRTGYRLIACFAGSNKEKWLCQCRSRHQ